jgi:crotonobetainyl-CoA:carnitine CoA-transferase CaiB-like acyl-CoA transferase
VSAYTLKGVRVVSIAVNVPGPAAVARLVAQGAAALKVEPPWGDPLAQLCPSFYDELHRGVERITLDLKSAEGIAALFDRLANADLFLASHRPSALARLGLDADSVIARCPSTRYLNIVGDTAEPEEAGHDLTYLAKEQLLANTLPPTLLADMAGSERAVTAALLLLRGAPGSRADVGLRDSLHALTAPRRHGLTAEGGILGGANPAYNVYRALDGFIAVAALEPHFRARLYEHLLLPDGAPLTDAFRHRKAKEWEQWALDRDIPLAAVTN